jgi:hypothetical protein
VVNWKREEISEDKVGDSPENKKSFGSPGQDGPTNVVVGRAAVARLRNAPGLAVQMKSSAARHSENVLYVRCAAVHDNTLLYG